MSAREVWVVEGRLLDQLWIAYVSKAKGDAQSQQRDLNRYYGSTARYTLAKYIPAPKPSKKGKAR